MSEHVPVTDSTIALSARAAARRLSVDHGPQLVVDVEAALHPHRRPDQYIDPISLGSLIVSVATLAWTVYQDLRTKKGKPTRQEIIRHIQLEPPSTDTATPAQRDRIIDVVVDEVLDEIEDTDK
jgi:hypothetical protein